MIAPVPTIRAIAAAPRIRVAVPSAPGDRMRVAALVAGYAVAEAVAAGILIFGTPLPPLLEGLAAAVSHGAAVLLLSGLTRPRPSCRWLCVAAVLAVPLVGTAIAAAAYLTRGRGPAVIDKRVKARRRPALTIAAMRLLRDSLSPSDALDCDDDEKRRAALSALSRRGDRESIAVLRRAAAGRDPDLALSAALALDEIGERAERQAGPS